MERLMTDEKLFEEFYSASLQSTSLNWVVDDLLEQRASEEELDEGVTKALDATIEACKLGKEVASRKLVLAYLDWGKEFGK